VSGSVEVLQEVPHFTLQKVASLCNMNTEMVKMKAGSETAANLQQ
jgi:hypothetical protein